MNRRLFLQSSFALATLGSSAAASKVPRIKAGFLGCSHSHAAPKIKLCADSGDFDLIGVCEPSKEVRAGLAPLSVQFLGEAEVIERSEVVFVESAVREHFAHARAVLKAGRHVHVEKPPAVKLSELAELIRLAREGGRVFQTGYMWRHNPGFLFLFKAVREGWIGDVFMVRAHMANQISAGSRGEWAEFAGGSFFEQASHMVDPLVRLLGAPKSIQSILRTHGSSKDALRDNNAATFEFDRALGVITNSSLQPNAFPTRSFEALGTLGRITLKPVEPPELEMDLSKPAGGWPAGKSAVPLPKYQRYAEDLAALASAIRGVAALPVALDEELKVHEALLRACLMDL